jgi:cytochrome P450
MGEVSRIPRFSLFDEHPDLHATLARLRQQAPVVRVRSIEDPTYIVLNHDCLRAALADDELFPPEASYSELMDPAVGRSVMSMDGAEHTRNRAIVSPPFQRNRMARHREQMLEREEQDARFQRGPGEFSPPAERRTGGADPLDTRLEI